LPFMLMFYKSQSDSCCRKAHAGGERLIKFSILWIMPSTLNTHSRKHLMAPTLECTYKNL